jgi:general secretion pathway protein F
MGAYSYQALDAKGKKVKGILEGDSPRQIRTLLKEKQLKPLEVNAVAGKHSIANENTSAFSRTKVSTKELALVTRQLATLVQANLPLDESLQATAQQVKRPQVKSMLLEVRARVLEGHSLAYGFGEFPRVFNELFRSMVKAGEHAGFLSLVLERLADYTENSQYTQQKIKMAMLYPFILMGVALSVIMALMVFVVPKLIQMFQSQNADLPPLTVALIATSDFIQSYKFIVLIGLIVAAFVAFKYWLKEESRRKRYHAFLLKVPFIGELLRALDTARFASTLSVLIASGVPLLEGLKIAGAVVSNLRLRDATGQIATAVQEGASLNKAMSETGVFPPMMVHMVASGESSGELESMLQRAANNQERELEMTLATVMGIFEPLMVVTMGGFVLMIVLAILMPIFQMNTLVQ